MLLLRFFLTHLALNESRMYSYTKEMIYKQTIWCYREENGFPFQSGSSEGLYQCTNSEMYVHIPTVSCCCLLKLVFATITSIKLNKFYMWISVKLLCELVPNDLVFMIYRMKRNSEDHSQRVMSVNYSFLFPYFSLPIILVHHLSIGCSSRTVLPDITFFFLPNYCI